MGNGAAVVICASLRKGACVDTARVPVPWRSHSSSARLCLSGTVTYVESDVDSTTSCQAASDHLVALSMSRSSKDMNDTKHSDGQKSIAMEQWLLAGISALHAEYVVPCADRSRFGILDS